MSYNLPANVSIIKTTNEELPPSFDSVGLGAIPEALFQLLCGVCRKGFLPATDGQGRTFLQDCVVPEKVAQRMEGVEDACVQCGLFPRFVLGCGRLPDNNVRYFPIGNTGLLRIPLSEQNSQS